MQLVRFKRDLRVYDHAALTEAARHGSAPPLYIAELGYRSQVDTSGHHWAFTAECPEVLPDVDDGDDRFGCSVDDLHRVIISVGDVANECRQGPSRR